MNQKYYVTVIMPQTKSFPQNAQVSTLKLLPVFSQLFHLMNLLRMVQISPLGQTSKRVVVVMKHFQSCFYHHLTFTSVQTFVKNILIFSANLYEPLTFHIFIFEIAFRIFDYGFQRIGQCG